MDMRQLKYFVQIVESGSLSRASRQLFIAQPALSQQMARLEEEVGKPLLVRSSRGVTPTENGDALYHHAKFMLRQLDQAVAVARREHSDVSGRVTIGLAPTTLCALGLPLMRHLRVEYPGIVLNVVEGLSGHLEQMARLGQLDLAILFSATAASELVVEPLLEEELFFIVPRTSDLVAPEREEISLQELTELPLILPSPGHGLRRRIALEFDRVNLSIDAVAEIDSLPLLMNCVADGIGGTIKPRAAVHALGDVPERWRCLRISDADMSRQNFLYSLPPEKLSQSASIVRTEIKTVIRKLIESGGWEGVRLPEPARTARADADEAELQANE
jgi:LysR family tcuABC transcriptional regulator